MGVLSLAFSSSEHATPAGLGWVELAGLAGRHVVVVGGRKRDCGFVGWWLFMGCWTRVGGGVFVVADVVVFMVCVVCFVLCRLVVVMLVMQVVVVLVLFHGADSYRVCGFFLL